MRQRAPCFLATVFVLPARTQRYAAPPVCCRCVVRAGTALERLSGPLAQAASAASAVGGGGVHVLQLPAHLSLLGYAYIIRGCSVLCTAAALGEAAAMQLCRSAGPLLTGAGLTMLAGSAGGGSSRRSGSGDMPLARSDTALQQLAALKACVTAIVVLLRAGRPVRDAGDLFQPAPMLRWLEAVVEALLAEHTQMSGKATEG